MKHVVSVSLGSSQRNGSAVHKFAGYDFCVERIGTDGDKHKAMQLIAEMDGKVDAFGLGGTDLYIYAGNRRYTFRETVAIAKAAKVTPVVDGSGIKNTLERRMVAYLNNNRGFEFRNKKTLLVCAVDRFGLADSLVTAGSHVVFGDLMFGLGLPIPIRTLRNLDRLARVIAPIITQMPIKWFYPTGKAQNEHRPKFDKYFSEAEIIAGDFHFIRRYAPDNLEGKLVITNTVTKDDEQMLRQRGVHTLVTTTPEIAGRSFGTNVLESMLVALIGPREYPVSPQEYEDMLNELHIEPRIKSLM